MYFIKIQDRCIVVTDVAQLEVRMMKLANADIIVIGAGIAGLMAARILEKQGAQVVVLDKGYQVGGRMATRRIGPGLADHGAQFFTTRTQEFRNWVHQWQYEKIAYLWSMGFSHGSVREAGERRHSRYAVSGGMNALAKHIAHDLDHVYTNTQVMTVTATGEDWLIQDQEGELYTCKGLIMTPPIPQSLEMLQAGATRLSVGVYEQVDSGNVDDTF
jgi:renalase